MSLILLISIGIRLVAMGWSVVLLQRTRDWRMGFLTVMLGLMAIRQILTLSETMESWSILAASQATEFPGLVVSVLTFLAVFFLERILIERKRTEGALINERDRAQKYLDVVEVMLVALNSQGEVRLINQKGCRILGYDREEEIVGKNWFDHFLPVSIKDEVKAVFQQLMTGETEPVEYFENPVVTKSGEERLIAWHNTLLSDEAGNIAGTLSSGEDITERTQAEAKIQAILDTTVDGIITINEKGIVESFNPAAEKIFGYSSEEVIGQNVKVLMPEPYHSEHDGYVTNYLRTGQARIIGIGREVVGKRKDGTTFSVDLAVSEFRLRERRMFTGIVRDITERKRLEEQLTQSAKLAALGELVGGIAHEVNNPTGIIVMRIASLMQEGTAQGLSEDLIDDIEVIQRQSDKIAQITSGLLAFSRKTPFSAQPTDINRTVSSAVGLVENVLRNKGIVYRPELAEDLPLVMLDATRIEQVLLNLFNNAMDAMPEGGELVVETVLETDAESKGWVQIRVKDTGCGIRKEDMGRLFDPFFTTKEVGKGTGLGLSISYGLVQEHGGRIEVESKWGEGAEFQIHLPVGGSNRKDSRV